MGDVDRVTFVRVLLSSSTGSNVLIYQVSYFWLFGQVLIIIAPQAGFPSHSVSLGHFVQNSFVILPTVTCS